jgi:hypothetical protein
LKKSKIILCSLLVILLAISLLTQSCSCDGGKKDYKPYFITFLSDGYVRIVATEMDSYDADISGYGNALAAAMNEILRDYIVIGETPIDYHYGDSSITKELHLIVKPK